MRLVGLLQQSMQEEQRRFSQLSQCLQALEAPKSASLVSAISRNQQEDDDDEGGQASHIRPLLGGPVADDASTTVKFRRPLIGAHISELSPLMESVGSCVGEGGSRPSSGASFAELSSFQHFGEPNQYSQSDDLDFGKKLSIQWDNAHAFDDGESPSQLDGAMVRVPNGDGAIAEDDETMLDELEVRVRAEQEHRDYLARELCLSQSRLAQLCAKNMKIFNMQQQVRVIFW